MGKPELSVVVIAYDMPREIPRTALSLSPQMQRGIEAKDYELIIVDNGSSRPFDEERCKAFGADVRVLRHSSRWPSPCEAINLGLAAAKGRLCGVWIDGARLASPGMLAGALAASDIHPRPVISTVGFHLGSENQAKASQKGYDQNEEDRLLDGAGWSKDGYRLFGISTFAGSSERGWFEPLGESNALFMSADMWRELGGYDERFRSSGGGLANLDVYARACALPDSQLITLLGEATFHQIHGGVTTGAATSRLEEFRKEYETIRGKRFERATRPAIYFGCVHPYVLPSIADSCGGGSPATYDPPTYPWKPRQTNESLSNPAPMPLPIPVPAESRGAFGSLLDSFRPHRAASIAEASARSSEPAVAAEQEVAIESDASLESRAAIESNADDVQAARTPSVSLTDRICAAVASDPRISVHALRKEVPELGAVDLRARTAKAGDALASETPQPVLERP